MSVDPDLAPFLRRRPEELSLLHAHQLDEAVTCLALNPECNIIAAGSIEDAVYVWNEHLQLLHSLAGHPGGTNALAFASAAHLVSAGEDGCAAVWDINTGNLVTRLACEGENADRTPDGHTVGHVACSGDGRRAACAAGRTVHVFEVAAGAEGEGSRLVFPAVPAGIINRLRWLGSDRLLASFYGGVKIWRCTPGTPGLELEYGADVLDVAASPDASWIVGGCFDSCVHIWHMSTPGEGRRGAPVASATNDDGGSSIDSDPAGGASRDDCGAADKNGCAGTSGADGACAAASAGSSSAGSDGDGTLTGDGGSSGLELVELSCGGYSSKVTVVEFSPDGRRMASTGGTVATVWGFDEEPGPAGSVPVHALGHSKALTALAWQPVAPGLLATGGKDGRVLLFDVFEATPPDPDEGMPSFAAPLAAAPSIEPQDEVTSLLWSGDGTRLYTSHMSGIVRCWQLGATAQRSHGATPINPPQ